MTTLLSWFRHLWMAMSLRGRLVTGYTALFALLLVGIALGETTVVRQVLIDDRKAALPGATSDLTAFLKSPVRPPPRRASPWRPTSPCSWRNRCAPWTRR